MGIQRLVFGDAQDRLPWTDGLELPTDNCFSADHKFCRDFLSSIA